MPIAYADKSPEETLTLLRTSPEGLSSEEAAKRLAEYGPNELRKKGGMFFIILGRQVASPFFYLLCVAALVSLFVGERLDSLVILLFISVNLFIGFLQEFRAERAVSLLKNLIPQNATVVRQGKQVRVDKRELVAGDVVALSVGDIVPAEMRVLEVHGLLIDESAITGESSPVAKYLPALSAPAQSMFDASTMLFTGTSVVSGKALGVVTATGPATTLGQIAQLVSASHRGGAYEKNLLYFCRLILKIVVITILVVFLLNLLLKGPGNFFEFLLFCVALIVSILPEALPAVVVLSLSRGSLKMAKDNVVVKRLASIEDLGNIEILCTDKTGTITQNKLTVTNVVSRDNDMAVLYALLEHSGQGNAAIAANPFSLAISHRAGKDVLATLKNYRLAAEVPFDSFRMRTSYVVENLKGEKILVVKGSPESVIRSCAKLGGGMTRKKLAEETQHVGRDGLRTLAIAYKKIAATKNLSRLTARDEGGLTFLGYFIFEDPLKATAEDAIRLSKKLGVRIKIITGDAREVAGYIAKKVGLVDDRHQVLLGEELEKLPPDEFDEACEERAVFARVSPETKHRIIKSLQKKHEVGFLGEGINDAPALKTADVGIAVAEASDIARESADVVLLKKDLRVVVNGIKHGRVIFANINKYIKCALASNFGNFYSIAAISLFIPFLPMLPVQILLGNLLSDFPLITIAADAVDIEELRKPKAYELRNILPLIIALALVSTVFDFIFFLIFYRSQPPTIQTLWFIESILTELALIYIIRTRHLFYRAKAPGFWLSFFTAIDAVAVVALPFLSFGQSFFHFISPPLIPLLIVGALVAAYFAASEVVKLVYFRYFRLNH